MCAWKYAGLQFVGGSVGGSGSRSVGGSVRQVAWRPTLRSAPRHGECRASDGRCTPKLSTPIAHGPGNLVCEPSPVEPQVASLQKTSKLPLGSGGVTSLGLSALLNRRMPFWGLFQRELTGNARPPPPPPFFCRASCWDKLTRPCGRVEALKQFKVSP